MSVKVYIDGQEGTTGLKILERFKDRNDIEIMKIDEDKRKDNDERKKFICVPLSARCRRKRGGRACKGQ